MVTKNWGSAVNPNVLWGYTCSATANHMSQSFPDIIRFYAQCEIQVCYCLNGEKRVLIVVDCFVLDEC